MSKTDRTSKAGRTQLVRDLMENPDITEAYVKKILVIGLYGAGLGWAPIADLLGMTTKQVYYIIKSQKERSKDAGKDTTKL